MKSKIRKCVLFAFVACFVFGPSGFSNAQEIISCLGNSTSEEGIMEGAKADFLSGNYRPFLDTVNTESNTPIENRREMVRILEQSFPGGFEKCQTILVEKYDPALMLEIFAFTADDGRTFFLSWLLRLSDRGWLVQKYVLSTDFDEIYSFWR